MQKWEYARLYHAATAPQGKSQWNIETVVQTTHGDKATLIEMLRDAGLDGWEVVGIAPPPTDGLILKRPAQ